MRTTWWGSTHDIDGNYYAKSSICRYACMEIYKQMIFMSPT